MPKLAAGQFTGRKLKKIMVRYFIFLSIIFLTGCKGCETEKPLQKVELPKEVAAREITFKRLDNDLFNSDFNNPRPACQQLYRKYGQFFCEYVEGDLMLASCKSDSVCSLLNGFVSNRDIKTSKAEIDKVFPDEVLSQYTEQLTDAFRKWNFYFPDSIVPEVIYYQSAWNNNIHPTDSAVGIALDCYLGTQNSIIKKLHPEFFPKYKKDNMEAAFMVADAVKGWVAYKSKHYYSPKNLLSEMIFYGKLMYISEALVPELPDSVMMNWTSGEVEWAEKNEWLTWKTIANEKVLFQQKPFEINKWFTDGPFTGAAGVPQDSPPQLGVWFGWNIVRQFMQSNQGVTLQALLSETDDQKILSAFKPKRN